MDHVAPGPPDAFWRNLEAKLRAQPLVNQLKLGKRGVYLITDDDAVASFQLVPWQQIQQSVEKPEN